MKRRPTRISKVLDEVSALDADRVDRLYGLEPAYEPGSAPAAGIRPEEFVAFQCPWCGERLETRIDVSGAEHAFVEDCQVCCRPMELTLELAENGALAALRVERVD
jgi:predicted RNA-binding Zn-ribbon protein involved in translation (DUF1610 family)